MAKSSWKSAEEEFVDSFDKLGKKAFVHRLSDTAAAKAVAGSRAFTVAQPSDFIITVPDGTYYAEVKSTKDAEAFHFSNIRKGQLAASRRVIAAGGLYFFFIKSLLDRQWYCVPAAIVHAAPLKHLTWSELTPYKVTL